MMRKISTGTDSTFRQVAKTCCGLSEVLMKRNSPVSSPSVSTTRITLTQA